MSGAHRAPTAFTDTARAYWKAVVAFVAPAVVILAVPLAQGGPPASEDYYMALGAALVTSFGVAKARNQEPYSG